MTIVVAPGHGSNRVAMALKDPQAPASLRVPEPDIAGAGQEPPLVCVPRQTLDMGPRLFDHLHAASGADVPESDRPVPAPGQDSTVARVKDGMVDAIRVTLEYLQQLRVW